MQTPNAITRAMTGLERHVTDMGRAELPGDMGCYAHTIDSEGNRVGLHAAS